MAKSGRLNAFLRLGLSGALIALACTVFINRQALLDQVAVWRYTPSPQIAAMTERTTMNDRGAFLFYATNPELLQREAFNGACRSSPTEHTAILGCYSSGRIYLFDIDDERLDGIKEVTAAHEMLHGAYERLSESERQKVNGLLEDQDLGEQKEYIESLMAEYEKTEPGQRLNELHSIIGTEVANLSPELEAYYGRYFTNRKQVAQLATSYRSVFNELEDRQSILVNEINELAVTIERDAAQYRSDAAQLSSDVSAFNRRASSGTMSREAYESERSQLLARQSELQSTYTTLQSQIADFERKKDELATINSQSQELNRSINSSLSPPKDNIDG